MTFKMTGRVYIAVLVYIAWVVLYLVWDYSREQSRIYEKIDSTLTTSALAAPLLLPYSFHHRDMKPGDIDPANDLKNTLQLSQYAQNTDAIYLYTLIKKANTVYFTSSSATEAELASGKELYNYFEPYETADPRINELILPVNYHPKVDA